MASSAHSINLSLSNLITLPPVAENHPTIGGALSLSSVFEGCATYSTGACPLFASTLTRTPFLALSSVSSTLFTLTRTQRPFPNPKDQQTPTIAIPYLHHPNRVPQRGTSSYLSHKTLSFSRLPQEFIFFHRKSNKWDLHKALAEFTISFFEYSHLKWSFPERFELFNRINFSICEECTYPLYLSFLCLTLRKRVYINGYRRMDVY